MIEKNYSYFIQAKLDKFLGEWIAISDNKIVSHNKDFKKVYKEAKSLAKEKPLFFKVPDKSPMIF